MVKKTGCSIALLLVGLAFFSQHANASTATPAFSTGTGTYYAPITLTISDTTSGAAIYYTTDGSTPTAASSLYSGPVTLSNTTTVNAIAVAAGISSSVKSATFTINIPLTPSFSTGTGTYYAPLSISLRDGTSCASVYYTTDGTTPTTASTLYTGPFAVSKTTTAKAIAVCSGGNPSSVASATFTISTPLTPSFSTGTGTYYAPLSISLKDGTSCASVYYTTDGTTPSTASTLYTGPFTVSTTKTTKAIAVCPGGSPSAVASAIFTISVPATPSFSTGTGAYYAPITLSIKDATSCASLYYTTDGTTPTTASNLYTGPVTVSTTTTTKAVAVCSGGNPSAVASATFTISAPLTPSFSTGTGIYHAPISVSIKDGTTCASIYYTTDGTTPTTSSTLYSGAFTVSQTTTAKAIGICSGGNPSTVASATFTITPAATPVLSLASGTYERSVNVSITDATNGAVIYYTTNGTTPSTASSVYSGALTFSNTSSFSTTVPLKAAGVYPGGSASPVTSANYTILSTITPVHSQNNDSSFFGMDVNGLLNGTPWPVVSFGTLRLWDTQTLWSTLHPAQGSFQWTNLDKVVQLAEGNKAQLLFTFGATPAWAIPTNVPISGIARANGLVTVTTSAPHGMYYSTIYAAGDQSSITIAGVADNSFNGTFVITGTPSATALTYRQTGPDTSSSSGTLSAMCSGPYTPNGCAEAPAHLSDWDNFVTALIDHAGPGVIHYWELWDEANMANTWRGDPKILVSMAGDARQIIKAADPNAVILSPSTTASLETPYECANYDPRCGSAWMARWLALGGATAVDGVAFHGYPAVGEAPEQIQGAIALMQSAMNQNGVGSLPIVDTEVSWGLNTALANSSDQVAFVGRHLLLEQALGIQSAVWYSYDGSSWGTLWSAQSGVNAAGDAYAQATRWLQGASVTQPCAPTASDATTFTCTYSRPNGYSAIAIWNTAGQKTVTVPQGYIQYHDLYGNFVGVSGGSIQISTAPILLETSSAF